MAFLMLCDIPVYDISTGEVITPQLCPFKVGLQVKKAYEIWRVKNYIAEQIVLKAGVATWEAKRRLSLSDGYWIKYNYDRNIVFKAITPYLNTFRVRFPN